MYALYQLVQFKIIQRYTAMTSIKKNLQYTSGTKGSIVAILTNTREASLCVNT